MAEGIFVAKGEHRLELLLRLANRHGNAHGDVTFAAVAAGAAAQGL